MPKPQGGRRVLKVNLFGVSSFPVMGGSVEAHGRDDGLTHGPAAIAKLRRGSPIAIYRDWGAQTPLDDATRIADDLAFALAEAGLAAAWRNFIRIRQSGSSSCYIGVRRSHKKGPFPCRWKTDS